MNFVLCMIAWIWVLQVAVLWFLLLREARKGIDMRSGWERPANNPHKPYDLTEVEERKSAA